MGDGVLATFATPSLAIECARGIQQATNELGIEVRAAVDAAEIEQRDGDIFGLGVTIAARALGRANGDEIVVTSTVAQALTGSDHEFR